MQNHCQLLLAQTSDSQHYTNNNSVLCYYVEAIDNTSVSNNSQAHIMQQTHSAHGYPTMYYDYSMLEQQCILTQSFLLPYYVLHNTYLMLKMLLA